MGTQNVNEIELQNVESPIDSSVGVEFSFPLYAGNGAASSAVVYFEVAPGKRLPLHRDSAEETLYIVGGEGLATIGENTAPVKTGDLAVVPTWEPHGVENTGSEPLKVIGFFAGAAITSVFTEKLFPGEGRFTVMHNTEGPGVYMAEALQPAGVA
jgi:quercetin dioxygenase-like cupin family protein